MSPTEFTYFLKGFLASKDYVSMDDLQMIKDELAKVGGETTSAPKKDEGIPEDLPTLPPEDKPWSMT